MGTKRTRRLLREAADFTRDFLGGRLAVDPSLTPGGLRAGEAAVMVVGDEWVAVRRDAEGRLHTLSAECTHHGCLVQWNASADAWDCRCHGSRYSKDGKPIAGPARDPLEPRG
ncbi:MAG: Rieske 2Fe-2S domain-containing protein [Thermoleophilaceae bacterium]